MIHPRLVARHWYAFAWVVCMAMGCTGVLQQASEPKGEGAHVPKQLQARQVIVTLAPASPARWASLATAIAEEYHLPQVGAFPLTSLAIQCLVFQIPEGRAVEELVARLATDPRVESVQSNQVFQGLSVVYNDPYGALQYGARAIRADMAHRWATGKGVRIAIVDTGVTVEHPDLHGRIAKTATFVEGGEETFAQDSHGTAVAGVIAARANNGIGIFGIAPEADILAVKACWEGASGAREALCTSWTLAKAVDLTMLERVQILNLSLAGPPDPLLARLISKAVEGGMIVVAAVLERGKQAPGFPASLEAVIAVVASDTRGQVGSAVGERRTPMLAAPGIEILTTAPRQAYTFLSGSSLAAAHVTGIAALLLELNPQLSPAQLSALLRATAQPVQVADGVSAATIGLVDACVALEKLLEPLTCP